MEDKKRIMGKKIFTILFATMMEYIQLGVDEKPIFEEVRENKFERLEREKEVLGLYISTHPIVYAKQKIKHPLVNLIDVENYMDRTIPVVCSISSVRAIRNYWVPGAG